MPLAENEPQTLDEKIELLRAFRGRFDHVEDFVYGIFSRDEKRVLGGTGLHTRVGEDAFEIGYWIRADAVGQGLCTEATAALTRTAIEACGADRVEIRVEPSNARSAAVPRRLGFVEEATLRRRLPGLRDVTVFTLFADDLPASPAARAALAAYDAAGRAVPLRA